ncbi:MAG: hypothetical protein ACR5K7_05755 [Symbiopectobacterium sp.]
MSLCLTLPPPRWSLLSEMTPALRFGPLTATDAVSGGVSCGSPRAWQGYLSSGTKFLRFCKDVPPVGAAGYTWQKTRIGLRRKTTGFGGFLLIAVGN